MQKSIVTGHGVNSNNQTLSIYNRIKEYVANKERECYNEFIQRAFALFGACVLKRARFYIYRREV